jgi:hypothetical protein
MITLEGNQLVFRFPEVHEGAECAIGFQRTLRIPDDEKKYPLPPGLGYFPLRHLDDYVEKMPEDWAARGGVMMPMHQAEAMWLYFRSHGYFDGPSYPFAVKVATGKICAVTGEEWTNHLNSGPQDYMVIPEQPWLDGYCVEKGVIRQFVAMSLGEGYSAEEQVTGKGEWGGLQISVYPMKAERYEKLRAEEAEKMEHLACMHMDLGMGLAPGGRMKQEIYEDPYGLDAWDQRHCSRCFVTIANSAQWLELTGEAPPHTPPSARDYTSAGLPWFDYYGGDNKALEGAQKLTKVKSVQQVGKAKGETVLPDNESLQMDYLVMLSKSKERPVRETTF